MNAVTAVLVLVAAVWLTSRVASVLVRSVTLLAAHFRIPPSIAGASLAAVSTSAPELTTTFFGLQRAREGHSAVEDLGMATVFGSALFNLAVIVGLVALRSSGRLERAVIRRDGIVYCCAIFLVLVFLSSGRVLSTVEAWALFGVYALYLLWLAYDVRAERRAPQTEHEVSWRPELLKMVAATLAIVATSHLLVEATQVLAEEGGRALNIPARTLTVFVAAVAIAIGSSIPDVLTSLEAAKRGEASLAVSNAVGSNTFDLLICLGVPYATVGGEAVTPATVRLGMGVAVVAVLFLVLLWRHAHLKRRHAVVLLGAYGLTLFAVILEEATSR
ncbi:MAG: sodium:calcium antiporter [Myxococcota bacterium]